MSRCAASRHAGDPRAPRRSGPHPRRPVGLSATESSSAAISPPDEPPSTGRAAPPGRDVGRRARGARRNRDRRRRAGVDAASLLHTGATGRDRSKQRPHRGESGCIGRRPDRPARRARDTASSTSDGAIGSPARGSTAVRTPATSDRKAPDGARRVKRPARHRCSSDSRSPAVGARAARETSPRGPFAPRRRRSRHCSRPTHLGSPCGSHSCVDLRSWSRALPQAATGSERCRCVSCAATGPPCRASRCRCPPTRRAAGIEDAGARGALPRGRRAERCSDRSAATTPIGAPSARTPHRASEDRADGVSPPARTWTENDGCRSREASVPLADSASRTLLRTRRRGCRHPCDASVAGGRDGCRDPRVGPGSSVRVRPVGGDGRSSSRAAHSARAPVVARRAPLHVAHLSEPVVARANERAEVRRVRAPAHVAGCTRKLIGPARCARTAPRRRHGDVVARAVAAARRAPRREGRTPGASRAPLDPRQRDNATTRRASRVARRARGMRRARRRRTPRRLGCCAPPRMPQPSTSTGGLRSGRRASAR